MKYNFLLIIFTLFFLIIRINFSSFAFAFDSKTNNGDSLQTEQISKSNIINNSKDTQATYNTNILKKTPSGAIWRSLVFPGWGQVYVEQYWKAPIFAAASGTLVYFIFHYNSLYSDWADKYDNLKKEQPESQYLDYYKSKREYYRDNRDMSAFYLLGVYILCTVDAYVGAHLYDFNVNDLTFNISPNYYGGLSFNMYLPFCLQNSIKTK